MAPSPPERAKNAAHFEAIVVSYRCRQILKAYPDNADDITRLRFSHGLGRELWIAMSSIGIIVGAELSGGLPKRVPTLSLVGELLKLAEWHGLSLSIDISKLDRDRLCKHYQDRDDLHVGVENHIHLVGEQWWTWLSPATENKSPPAWWRDPLMIVTRPMPSWAHDTVDAGEYVAYIEASASNLLDSNKRQKDLEEALNHKTTRALSAQLKEDEDFRLDHDYSCHESPPGMYTFTANRFDVVPDQTSAAPSPTPFTGYWALPSFTLATADTSKSDLKLFNTCKHYGYSNQIGHGLYDINSPRVPSERELRERLTAMLTKLRRDLVVINHDRSLKTHCWKETETKLVNLVNATWAHQTQT